MLPISRSPLVIGIVFGEPPLSILLRLLHRKRLDDLPAIPNVCNPCKLRMSNPSLVRIREAQTTYNTSRSPDLEK
jgi:hypothetical protein